MELRGGFPISPVFFVHGLVCFGRNVLEMCQTMSARVSASISKGHTVLGVCAGEQHTFLYSHASDCLLSQTWCNQDCFRAVS